jgi:hypothetical protein
VKLRKLIVRVVGYYSAMRPEVRGFQKALEILQSAVGCTVEIGANRCLSSTPAWPASADIGGFYDVGPRPAKSTADCRRHTKLRAGLLFKA